MIHNTFFGHAVLAFVLQWQGALHERLCAAVLVFLIIGLSSQRSDGRFAGLQALQDIFFSPGVAGKTATPGEKEDLRG
jgi:hypothetical protein